MNRVKTKTGIVSLKAKGIAVLFMLSLCYTVPAGAQNAGDHYLYPGFEKAVVVFKTGQREAINLNYNTVTEEMVFTRSNQYLALDLIETIDSVIFHKDVFIPHEDVFLKLYATEPVNLFIRYKNKFLNTGKSTGFGSTQTNAIDNYSSIISSGQIYELDISGDYQLVAENSIYLNDADGLKKADNIRDLSNLFSVRGKDIRNYIKVNNLNLEDIEDLKDLIVFLIEQR